MRLFPIFLIISQAKSSFFDVCPSSRESIGGEARFIFLLLIFYYFQNASPDCARQAPNASITTAVGVELF